MVNYDVGIGKRSTRQVKMDVTATRPRVVVEIHACFGSSSVTVLHRVAAHEFTT